MISYFDLLGLPPDADRKAVEAAFRPLALMLHPDRQKAGDKPAAERLLKMLLAARDTLANDRKRAEYRASIEALGGQQHSGVDPWAKFLRAAEWVRDNPTAQMIIQQTVSRFLKPTP